MIRLTSTSSTTSKCCPKVYLTVAYTEGRLCLLASLKGVDKVDEPRVIVVHSVLDNDGDRAQKCVGEEGVGGR